MRRGPSLRRRHRDDHFRRAGGSGDFDLERQLGSDLLQAAGSGVLRLGDEIERAERQSFQRERRAFLGVRADDDHRHAMLARDLAQHLDAVHARHVQIERDHVRVQLLNLAQADQAIHRRADDFDRGIVVSRVCGMSFRISAESSTTSTRIFRLAHAIAPTAGNARKMRHDRGNVEDQHDGAVAQDRSAADERRRDQLIFERFDDQFFFAHQTVHGQAELAAASADHDHEEALGALAATACGPRRSRRTSVRTCSRS